MTMMLPFKQMREPIFRFVCWTCMHAYITTYHNPLIQHKCFLQYITAYCIIFMICIPKSEIIHLGVQNLKLNYPTRVVWLAGSIWFSNTIAHKTYNTQLVCVFCFVYNRFRCDKLEQSKHWSIYSSYHFLLFFFLSAAFLLFFWKLL